MSLVYIVEDDPAVACGLTAMLAAENYETRHFTSGEDALAAASEALSASAPPDLVLLDVSLPGLNGYEVCRRLREMDYPNPVIMLTARTQPVDRIVGLEVGADDYVCKPFNTRELTARIGAQLRRTERLHEKWAREEQGREHHAGGRPGDTASVSGADAGGRRHLLAVMFTDIVGYSRVMHENEMLGMRLLARHDAVLRGAIAAHAGTVVEIIGDAFLARFDSAVDGVAAALQAFDDLAASNNAAAADELIRVRIGLHLGDVLDFGQSIKGDTVNIAARLQQMAPPDALCISEQVYRAVIHKIACDFTDLGECMLKNIDEPVRVWQVERTRAQSR